MSLESPHSLSPPDEAAAHSAERGGNLRVSLACPKCEQVGWIAWQNLKHAIGCPGCKTKFQIGRLGKLELRSDTPLIRYQCPRCLQSGELPANVAIRGVQCGACQLSLVVGPDQQLHDKTEAKLLCKAQRAHSHAQRVAARNLFAERSWYLQPAKLLPVAAMVLAIVVLGLMGWRMLRGPLPEQQVAAFTAECLAGEWNEALEYVIDDPVQEAEFTRWRVRHFTSIQNKHRPHGDRMYIQPELVREIPEANTYRVNLSSQHIGQRAHDQIWSEVAGEWRFDVLATLAITQQSADKSEDEEAKVTLPGKPRHAPSSSRPRPKLPNNPYSRKY